ncbi:diaminopimelate decarboxylase family protein [Geosporobacter ferrireducens]|uniref:Diaminopimelate decarboxylase n=1 Tax=Geosporobacter ferrireducens TaxID=1424294 RepID=A0A1D8GF02_9FIRM|nr:diaminopimelate decarboxylase [Geosporobacter ferrireducens]AOT69480.1 diaminopimelate decarboxylase [Geosporobacter ferrireducens]
MKTVPFSYDKLKKIISEFPTPFYIYDEKAIRENVRDLMKAFSWNGGYHQYFAVKSTPNPSILKIFKEEGCGVDCTSLTELILADLCGFSKEEIMFTSNVTPSNEYVLAKNLGAIINLDDTTHIDFLNNCAGIPEIICCRLNLGEDIKYQDKVVINFRSSKFGSTQDQIYDGFGYLQELGVNRFGIHTQFGAHKRDADYFGNNSRKVFRFVIDLYNNTGIKVDFINLAGGLGIPFLPDDSPANIEAISYSIKKAYDETIVAAGLDPISLFTELGIYMTGPYGYFVSSVLHVKKTYKNFLGLDASTNSFMSPARYNDYYHITVMGNENEACNCVYDVTGALCEDRDRFAVNRLLPYTKEGNILVFHDAGAYTYSHSYNFNGKLRPAELLLCTDGSVKMIRRAETPEDYFATLKF